MRYEHENWKGELATTELLRAATMLLPMIGAFIAIGFLLNCVLSSPFEFTCRSARRLKPDYVRLRPEPMQAVTAKK